MEDYNSGKWIGWNGGECPVHPETVVEVQFWNGRDNELACHWEWAHSNNGYGPDIIAFRVIKEHKEPREFWIDPKIGAICSGKPTSIGWIHVREVLE